MKSSIYCLFVLFLATSPLYAQAAEKPQALKVGVVDVAVAFSQYKKTDALSRQLTEYRNKGRVKLREQRSQIQKITAALRRFAQGSERYEAFEDKISLEKSRLKLMEDRLKKRLEKALARLREEIYQEIQAAVAQCAKEKGLDLVFQTSSTKASKENRAKQLNQPKLLYFRETLDITKDVVTLLNKALQKEKKEAPKKSQ